MQDLAITGCGGTGVTINDTGNDTVSGCYIGVAPDGNTAAENLGYGVEISGSCGNSLQSDVISANALGGVEITSGASNTIANTAIGTNADGRPARCYLATASRAMASNSNCQQQGEQRHDLGQPLGRGPHQRRQIHGKYGHKQQCRHGRKRC